MQATYEAKVRDVTLYSLLDAIADLYGRAERCLYVDRCVRGQPLKDLKREYLVQFGLTARQFNAVSAQLDGKVKASRDALHRQVESLRRRIRATRDEIAGLEERCRREPGAKQKLRSLLHQKKRRFRLLTDRLAGAERQMARPPVICFGGRKQFRAQFHLEENGYASHEEWRADWRASRSSQFLCLGSKDESAGNQTATLGADGVMRLRVPNALIPEYGRWVMMENIRFRYGQEVIDRALASGQAITYRFVRRERGWYVQATTERPDAEIVTSRALGALGVDLNPHLVAVGRIDRHGNPTEARHIPVQLEGRRKKQVEAALGDVVAEVVAWAKVEGVPIVIERLDFEAKKARLRGMSPRYARLLSAFVYRRFEALLVSRAVREGVEIIRVNPAYTSVIGVVKFASGYGLSPHASRAVAIARRGLRFGERLRSRSALLLPARNRRRHVWSDWNRVSRRLGSETLRGRRPSEGGRGRGIPLSSAAPLPEAHGPPRDGLAPAPGCDPPAQIVGSAVRPAS